MRKRNGKGLYAAALAMVVAATIFVGTGVTSFAYTETTGTVNTENVKVRESASTTASQVSSLRNGDKIDIVDEATDASGYVWYKIRVNKSEFGYVRSDLVDKKGGSSSDNSEKKTETTSSESTSTTSNKTENNAAAAALPATTVTSTDQKPATITSDSVNVRQGAGTAYDSVGKVTKGDTVTVTGEATGTDNKTWYQVTFGSSGKTGFIRSDLLSVGEPETDDSQEGEEGEAVEGEEGEGEEAEASEDGESEESSGSSSAVTSEAGDGTYSLVYLTDEEGGSTWYLYDNVEGYRVKVNELIEAAKSSDAVNKLVKTNNTYKTVLVILAIIVAALVLGLIFLALKLRDSIYYEDEEEEYDRYATPKRRARDDSEDEDERYRARRNPDRDADNERTVRPSRTTEDRTPRTSSARRPVSEDDDRPVRRPSKNADERPSRYADDRDSRADRASEERASRRDDDRYSEDRAPRTSSARRPAPDYDRDERPSSADRDDAPRRRSRNFVNRDDDDLEFVFLDLDDDK